MKKIKICLSLFLTVFLFISCKKEAVLHELNIIPEPEEMKIVPGEFEINKKTRILFSDNKDVERIANFFSEELANYGLKIEKEILSGNSDTSYTVIFELHKTIYNDPEAYVVKTSENAVKISATDPKGLFYGYQTLKQLLPVNYEDKPFIPMVEIFDTPQFKWRGMHLDVCRHFFRKEFVMKYIDYLASVKMNTFHWHLSEDQGWRIEIKAYPFLTETGAWRNETVIGHARNKPAEFDGKKYGGFYTQEDIKEIVKYASDRFITIVPEIEMPGHAQAAIASYPFLGCTEDEVDVWTTWGVSPYIYNLEDTTFAFLKTVLSEVIELFPGKYIHIGGDEAPKEQWKKSKRIQQQMKELGLKDEHELQSYFVQRIEKFLNSKAKILIGWDEILEGGLAPNAVVMSWRGTEGGIEASKAGHYVVMSPGTHCYFDHYQSEDTDNEPLAIGGFTDVEKVYSFNPIPEELTEEEANFIMGAQANVWSEYISTPEHVEYMIFPRMLALSEVLWSAADKKDYYDFLKRLTHYRAVMDREGINYAKHVFVSE